MNLVSNWRNNGLGPDLVSVQDAITLKNHSCNQREDLYEICGSNTACKVNLASWHQTTGSLLTGCPSIVWGINFSIVITHLSVSIGHKQSWAKWLHFHLSQ